jgi:predicted phage gp36 major capsid-like protein
MAMKEVLEIQNEVFRVIRRLMEEYLDDLERKYTEEPDEESADLLSLLRDLERLVDKAERSYVGGYTIFAYNVLLGVLEGLSEVYEWLQIYLDKLRWKAL